MPDIGLSKLEIRGQLGRGGTARVDRVTRPGQSCEYALKRVLPGQSDPTVDFAALARREWELIGGRRFPGLVRLLEHGSKPEDYLLMELCPGSSIDEIGRVEDINTALNIISAMAVDLEYLRLAGLIHADIKPHNFFMPMTHARLGSDRLAFVKLSDFSLGRRVNEPESKRLGSGTVGYMAPEVIDTNNVNHRSDLFALGVTAYEVLTGVHPFMNGESDPAVINSRVKEDQPEPVRIIREDCPELVADLVKSLMSVSPESRPKSAWQVCEILENAGATYPFRKALTPTAALQTHDSYDSNLSHLLSLDTAQRKRLDLITGCKVSHLKWVLAMNFRRGLLRYNGERFEFNRDIYWPSRHRRYVISFWSSLSLSEQRQAITRAVASETDGRGGGAIDTQVASSIHNQLQSLLPGLLRTRTVRRLSRNLAPSVDDAGQFERAARLYLQAGDLDRTTTCLASVDWKRDKEHAHQYHNFLRVAIDYAGMQGRLFDARQLLMIQGDLQKAQGDANAAEATYRRLMSLYGNHPADELLAETYKDLGDLYKMKQDLTSGLAALEKALEIYKNLHNELEVSHVLNNIGNLHFFGADFRKAIACYSQALHIQRRLQVQTDVASTLSNMGSVYAIRGRYKRAARILNLSLNLKRELGDPGEIARTLNNLGYLYHVMGTNQKGIDCLTESLRLNRETGNQKEVLFNLENLGTVMIAAGQLRKSIDYLREGLAIADKLGDKPHLGIFRLRLSTVLRRLGKFDDAMHRLKEAQEIAVGIDDWFLRVSCLLEQAKLHHYIGDTDRARALARDAYADAKKIEDKSLQLEATLFLSRVSEDDQYGRDGHALADELHLSREHLLLAFNRIEILLTGGRHEEASSLFKQHATGLANLVDDLELPRLMLVAAGVLVENGDWKAASKHARDALGICRTAGMLPEQMEANILLGRKEFQEGDYEKCYGSYRDALQVAKECAGNIGDSNVRAVYQQQPPIQFLAKEIRRLSELLGQKTKGR